MKNRILLVVLLVFAGIQFIRPEKNAGVRDTEKDITNYLHVPQNVMTILKTSCYDCHSDRTEYPWYSAINPVGLWLAHHVDEGKEELNFSDFSQYPVSKIDHKLEEIAEVVEEREMPLKSYTIMHGNAALSEEQITVIKNWVSGERAKISK